MIAAIILGIMFILMTIGFEIIYYIDEKELEKKEKTK
ncbi:hypothetical protein SAMN06265339_0695 [Desulfurobacterium pacificum]|uniref:Uncharacterized protein n=1 Tax=Desulfurobacterium pacificum TaxID=240166 RepID=A0ABY1NJ98_9BACT|nr:hypothetical protein SAMN06265339_0695 [Desulfurobacterium pacificum]